MGSEPEKIEKARNGGQGKGQGSRLQNGKTQPSTDPPFHSKGVKKTVYQQVLGPKGLSPANKTAQNFKNWETEGGARTKKISFALQKKI